MRIAETQRRRSRDAFRAVALVALAFGAMQAAHAADYKSVGNDPAILYDAPTLRGTRIAVAPRGMPVEVVVAQGDWARVRDSAGGFSWVERKALVDKRIVVVTDPVPVEVRAAPDDGAPSVFRAQAGVMLELASPPSSGWVGVRHRDGQSGFVRVGSVWGE
jgi:hypothetical protein